MHRDYFEYSVKIGVSIRHEYKTWQEFEDNVSKTIKCIHFHGEVKAELLRIMLPRQE